MKLLKTYSRKSVIAILWKKTSILPQCLSLILKKEMGTEVHKVICCIQLKIVSLQC